MNNFLTILKTVNKNNFKINRQLSSKNLSKKILSLLFIAFICIVMIGYSSMYSYIGIQFMSEYSLEKYVPLLFYVVSCLGIFITSIYKAKPTLFDSNDNDLLFSMPIKTSTILATRLVTLLQINYLIVLFAFIPSCVVYLVMVGFSPALLISMILIALATPVIPTLLASIIGYVVGAIASSSNSKKMVETVTSLLAFLTVYACITQISTLANTVVANMQSIETFIQKYLVILNLVKEAIFSGKSTYALAYIAVNAILFALFVTVLNKGFTKIVSKQKAVKQKVAKKSKKENQYKGRTEMGALLMKELKKFITTPIYILNTSFGLVILLLITGSTIIFGSSIVSMATSQIAGEAGLSLPFMVVLLIFATFIVSTANTACTSISLEGKNFWILRSLPIRVTQIFKAKILFNIILVLPITLICITYLAILMEVAVLDILTLIMFISVTSILCSIFGLLINLRYPKIDFVSDAQVIKQSMSTFVGTFIPMAFIMFIVFIPSVVSIPLRLYLYCTIGAFIILIFIMWKIVKTWGVKAFKNI